MKPKSKSLILQLGIIFLGLISLGIIICDCFAEEKYPSRPIQIIVNYSPGGGTDIMARAIAPYLQKELGVPIVIVNRPGGGSIVGTNAFMDAKHDGYTLNNFNILTTIMASYEKGAKFKVPDDFQFIGSISDDTYCFAVHPGTPYKKFDDFIADAKKRPGEINVAILGPTGEPAISMYEVQDLLGIKLNLVTYKAGADGTTELLSGYIGAQTVPASRTVDLHKGGRLRILTIFDEKRAKNLPDVPTFKEVTGKQLNISAVRGLVCQSGVPKERVRILRDAWNKVIKNEELLKKLEQMQPIYPRTGEEFEKYCIEQIPVSKMAQALIERVAKEAYLPKK